MRTNPTISLRSEELQSSNTDSSRFSSTGGPDFAFYMKTYYKIADVFLYTPLGIHDVLRNFIQTLYAAKKLSRTTTDHV